MSLADHYNGMNWLQEGWHVVSVTGHKIFQYKTGSDGVEFELQNAEGKTGKVSFCLVNNILWRLADFAKACGLTKEEAAGYEPTSPNSHRILVGRKLQVRLEKGEKFHEVVEWLDVGERVSDRPLPLPVDRPANNTKSSDDIPF